MRLYLFTQLVCLFLLVLVFRAPAQAPPQQSAPAPADPSRADILRGEYGPWRANNDLLSYDLSIRVDPEKKFISWKEYDPFQDAEG